MQVLFRTRDPEGSRLRDQVERRSRDVGVRMESFGIIYRRGHVLPPAAERMLLALRTTARWLYPGLRGSG